MNPPCATDQRLRALRQAGAPALDAVAWHYIEALAQRTRTHTGKARDLLQNRLRSTLDEFEARLAAQPDSHPAGPMPAPGVSPLALLLQEMTSKTSAPAGAGPGAPDWRAENPRVRQLRTQLRKISLQKQVSQAIAQAPKNAGPINSQMLVLRALSLMREISPEYLNRFMTYADTLLSLHEAEQTRPAPRKKASGGKSGH